MTEDTGFPAPAEPPLPAFTPEPETPEEPIAAEDVPAEPEPAEALSEPSPIQTDLSGTPAPELPPTAPFIPSEGVAGWLRDALLDFDRRLRNAGF